DIPVLLHEEHVRTRRVHRDSMHAMTYLGVRVRDAFRPEAVVDRPPGLATVGGTEESRVFGARIDGVRVGQGWLEVPDSLELEGTRRPVIPLMCAGFAVVGELALHRLPCLAAVVGALDHLPEPARILRGVQPVRIGWGPLDVVDLPAGEVRAADIPLLAFRVRCHHEGALVCTDQYPNPAHSFLLLRESLCQLREPHRRMPT